MNATATAPVGRNHALLLLIAALLLVAPLLPRQPVLQSAALRCS